MSKEFKVAASGGQAAGHNIINEAPAAQRIQIGDISGGVHFTTKVVIQPGPGHIGNPQGIRLHELVNDLSERELETVYRVVAEWKKQSRQNGAI